MAPSAEAPGSELTYVVYAIEPRASGTYAISVQMPDRSTVTVLVPGAGLSFDRVRMSVDVVAMLWRTKRGATPVGQD